MGSMNVRGRWPRSLAILPILALLASPALAAKAPGEVLTRGADLWQTAANFSYTSFRSEPIPAGFFCEGSKPFTGAISLRGRPLATRPAKALGSIDTIVQRLDDAVVDAKGEASTRIRLMALSLESVKPIDTGCGLYDVAASLAGAQPTTTMRIQKTSSGGGTYVAPLELDVRLTFTPVSGRGERRELVHRISLGPAPGEVWSYAKPAVARTGEVAVDTDGDGVPDAVLPAPSNFRAGVAPAASFGTQTTCVVCHCDPNSTNPNQSAAGCDHLHCINVTMQGPCPATNQVSQTE